jgi:hypothetical protein
MTATSAWAKSGWAYTPGSVAEFMESVARLGAHNSTRRYLWRGQADMNWRLESSLARRIRVARQDVDEDSVAAAERYLVAEARKWPAPEFAGLLGDQQILAMLQHHGVPTGLLDATTDPMTALWFACESDTHSVTKRVSGALLAFDVTDWPTLQTESPDAYAKWSHKDDPLGAEYRLHLANGKPFVIEPSRPSGRMLAQRVGSSVPPSATDPTNQFRSRSLM